MITKAAIKAKILWVMPYSLMSFLIKKKALRNYLNNVSEEKFIVLCGCKLKNLPDRVFYCNDIGCAFIWRYTKEGSDYWSKLYVEYEKEKALHQGKL